MADTIDLSLLLKKLSDRMEQLANRQLQTHDLTFSQSKLLMILGHHEAQPVSMKDLEHHLRSAQSTISGLVERMEKKGLVLCIPSADDRRMKYVALTDAGKQLRARCIAQMRSNDAHLVSPLSDAQLPVLLDMLGRVYRNLCSDHFDPQTEPFPSVESHDKP